MLFPYTYVNHRIEKMQEFIDFIFYDVWCSAPGGTEFNLDLFSGNPDLKDVMTAFNYDHSEGGDFFYTHVQFIYEHFSALSPLQIDQLRQWYCANNDLERVCANDPAAIIARYADIRVMPPALCDQLEGFFKRLYSQNLLNLAAFREKIGEIDDHYKAFMSVNKSGKCPFCGISDMQGVYHTTREAYDHYFPKGLYPFNSINFHNLVPACHHCNSSYKTSKDPTYTPKDPAGETVRRKAFYPYANTAPNIQVTVNFGKSDIGDLEPADIQLEFGPAAVSEEIETWKDVYGIDERYKAKCCGQNDGKYWFTAVWDEWQEYGRTPAEFMDTLRRQAEKHPFADCNFLRNAFLDCCERNGLFAAL